ncbi:hypothetical protein PISMIDRAFT_437115 [Pisolithus microcarpus 441]|uniref:Uncharacterized protein n=1 Tax=Pisolithus microcarpus 441 TaxID=765257 RepID=A0A0C9YXA8_9AGAM|nr:hypothetical protein PISMIDRAFT_437115 [Pisolithus microcarpus 441]
MRTWPTLWRRVSGAVRSYRQYAGSFTILLDYHLPMHQRDETTTYFSHFQPSNVRHFPFLTPSIIAA